MAHRRRSLRIRVTLALAGLAQIVVIHPAVARTAGGVGNASHAADADPANLPSCLLALGGAAPGIALVMEKETEKLFLYRARAGEAPELVRSWNATTGQSDGDKTARGDLKTPEGIYFFTRVIEDRELPAEYGERALVMNYPNLFDTRAGKTGDGIWLHATDEIVKPLTSNQTRGCVVVTNRDVVQISNLITLGETPIVVQEQLRRLDRQSWQAERDEVLRFLESWRRALADGQLDSYLGAYLPDFRADGRDPTALHTQKNGPTAGARVEVETLEPTVLRDHDQAIVRFAQLYRSEVRAEYGQKTLWLERRAGKWGIVAEEWRPVSPPARIAARLKPLPRVVAASAPTTEARPVSVASAPVASASAPAASAAAASPAVASPAVASPAVASPAAAPAEVVVRDFLADAGSSDVRVSFRLERAEQSRIAASGWLSLVVRMRSEAGSRTFTWPDGVRLARGEPVRPAAGDPYSIRRFKKVDAILKVVPAGAVLEQVSLYVYDANGRPLRREVYGG